MPIPKPAHSPVCAFCGATVNPIMARYLFLAVGWRGRPMGRDPKTQKFTFCGPCGDFVYHALEPYTRTRGRYHAHQEATA